MNLPVTLCNLLGFRRATSNNLVKSAVIGYFAFIFENSKRFTKYLSRYTILLFFVVRCRASVDKTMNAELVRQVIIDAICLGVGNIHFFKYFFKIN